MHVNRTRRAAASTATSEARPLLRGSVSSRALVRLGSAGAEVKKLQQALKRAGEYAGQVSGTFDQQTLKAVRSYQRKNDLQVDGIVGQQTWGAMIGKSYPPGTEMLKSAGGARSRSTGFSGRSSFDDGVRGRSGGGGGGGGKVSSAGTTTGYISGRPAPIGLANAGSGETMRTDAARAFKSMQRAAARAGISLSATSGFRSMSEQQALYQKYLNGTGNLAARPGYSNHQGGVSMDVGGVNGYGTSAYNWLRSNAGKFGFRNDVSGEFWHWTFRG